jgi:hypothetical protein
LAQRPGFPPNTLMFRTAGEPMLAAAHLQDTIGEIDPNLLAYNMRTLEDQIARTALPYRIFAYMRGFPEPLRFFSF